MCVTLKKKKNYTLRVDDTTMNKIQRPVDFQVFYSNNTLKYDHVSKFFEGIKRQNMLCSHVLRT